MELGNKLVDFKPMTWGTQKKVFQLIVEGLNKQAQASDLIKRMVMSALNGEEQAPGDLLMETINSMPELFTQALALGLGVSAEDLDNATGPQVMTALEVFIKENDLENQWARAKKAMSLLVPADQQAKPSDTGK